MGVRQSRVIKPESNLNNPIPPPIPTGSWKLPDRDATVSYLKSSDEWKSDEIELSVMINKSFLTDLGYTANIRYDYDTISKGVPDEGFIGHIDFTKECSNITIVFSINEPDGNHPYATINVYRNNGFGRNVYSTLISPLKFLKYENYQVNMDDEKLEFADYIGDRLMKDYLKTIYSDDGVLFYGDPGPSHEIFSRIELNAEHLKRELIDIEEEYNH